MGRSVHVRYLDGVESYQPIGRGERRRSLEEETVRPYNPKHSMKIKRLLTIVLLSASASGVALAQGQQQATPKSKLIQFHMALMKRGPKWPGDSAITPPALQEHVQYVQSLLE